MRGKQGAEPTGQPRRATRLDLANWLCNAEQGVGGLTARVMANRFWYLYFGTGISRSLTDFGGQGGSSCQPDPARRPRCRISRVRVGCENACPSPRHLTGLPAVVNHQSQKCRSATRTTKSSTANPASVSLPRSSVTPPSPFPGLLVREVGGRSARPYQPAGYFRHLNFPKRSYSHDTSKAQWRRGVYVHWQRMFLHPMMKAMDAPSREECTAERPRSNTPERSTHAPQRPDLYRSRARLRFPHPGRGRRDQSRTARIQLPPGPRTVPGSHRAGASCRASRPLERSIPGRSPCCTRLTQLRSEPTTEKC